MSNDKFYNTLCSCTKLAVIQGADFFEITNNDGIVLITVDFRKKEYTSSIEDDFNPVYICCPKSVTDVIKVFIDLGIFEINEAFILKNQSVGLYRKLSDCVGDSCN